MSLYGEKKLPADEAPTAQIAAVPANPGRPDPTRALPRQVQRGPATADPGAPGGPSGAPGGPSGAPGASGEATDPSMSPVPRIIPQRPGGAGVFGTGRGRPPMDRTPALDDTVRLGRWQPTGPATAAKTAAGPGAAGPVASGVPAAAPGAESDPLGSPTSGGRRGARRLVLAGGVAVALIAAGSGTAGFAYAGEVPRGTTVLGVELGGKSRTEAAHALQAGLARRADTFAAPVQVKIGEKTGAISPTDVGLAVDVAATVAASAESDPGPLGRLFGSHEVDPVVTVDAGLLDAALRGIVGKDGQKMTMPAITFAGTTPKAVYPKPGIDLVAERSAEAVQAGWLGGQPVEVPLVETHPATTAEELDQLLNEFARPAVAAPVTVTTDRGEFSVPPAAIAKSLVLKADKTGKVSPKMNEKKLRAALTDQLGKVEVKPRAASVSIDGGKPKVLASAGGRQVDTAALSRDLLDVLARSDGRQVAGKMKVVEPKTTTGELSGLGIKERVSSFTTQFDGGLSSPRSHNIIQAAKEVDGTLVKPGETFSLNRHTGERGYAQGYKDAPVILDGKLVPGVGGGISQFTTTLFNATYYAGLEDVEHKPHSYYFSRYPAVIESTIFYPNLDFKFRNNTEYGVLLDTSWTASSITVSVWSTKIWDKVSTEYGPRRNITSPRAVHLDPGPSCIATSGIPGFSQDAYRVFRKNGKEVKREKFSWTYEAEPRFVCAKRP